ncbi:uncharacterized protein LOC134193298 [Corticium candelabrum]|uniref:uncharacterized protein LOC134193298 n=1 Tax=Corticium candelabrum TaxID=121492 RepID=UPI002E2527A6|nr:uncharacterized protein LOC134193298 [Corticium candelabrum]XP_062518108.1 uncharacterized protein LOC134193298 [Corticium candelabrum]
MEQKLLLDDSNLGPAPAYDTQPAAGHAYYPPVGYQNVNSYAPVYTHQPVMSTTMVGNAEVVPRDYLCLSAISIVFCWPFGLAALFMAIKTRHMIAYGNIAAAMETSKIARIFAISALVFGCLLLASSVAMLLV